MRKRGILLLGILTVAYFAFRTPITATFVTDHWNLIFAQMRFEASCMRVVAALKRNEAMLAADPWGAIGRSILDRAAIEQ